MTERLNEGAFNQNPDEQPTEEIPVVEVEQPSRLKRVGNWILKGLEASGGYGYGSARMGVFIPPPRPPEIKTETDEDED